MIAVTVLFGSGSLDPPPPTASCSISAAPTNPNAPAIAGGGAKTISNLSPAQTANITTIIGAVKARGMSQQAAIIAIMVAAQESSIRNLANPGVPASMGLPHDGTGSDHDSVGIYQQRPSMGWGTVPELLTPSYAATKFLDTLATVPNWQALAYSVAAQRVQKSANGAWYAPWQGFAESVVSSFFDATTPAMACATANTANNVSQNLPAPSSSAAATAIAFERTKIGLPYQWGGTGNPYYDCSGLVQAAYKAAGISLPRTTSEQINVGTPVARADLQPGDLVFFTGHVGLYIGNGQMIDAPHTGAFIRQESVDAFARSDAYIGARRVTSPKAA
ncbi:C40 family peptidase [Enterococcus hirae]|uniref:C40 family peptidase n=1 Tax=Enterococcus hirae TaxID=1354 RepID=UPI0030EC3905